MSKRREQKSLKVLFKEWHDHCGFWHEGTRYKELWPIYEKLAMTYGIPSEEIEEIFDAFVYAMRDEYGD